MIAIAAGGRLDQPAIDDGLSSPYEAAPDGQRFLVRAAQQTAQPLTVLVNWPALLKK